MDETKLQSASAQEKKDALDLVRAYFVIREVNVTGGLLDNDRATLYVVGTLNVESKDQVKGEVNMHLEGGQWKVGESSMSVTGKSVAKPKV